LEGLVADVDEMHEEGDEGAVVARRMREYMESDRELLKRVIRGGFKTKGVAEPKRAKTNRVSCV
jgi:hypothetical protein